MDIANPFGKIGVFLADDGFIAILEKVTLASMPAIVGEYIENSHSIAIESIEHLVERNSRNGFD